jgi:LAO/AO transport system kinase
MVDFVLMLMLPNAGDELQIIKRGITEIADAIVVNKADGQFQKSAELAVGQVRNMLGLLAPRPGGWVAQVMKCSALEKTDIASVWNMCKEFFSQKAIQDYRRSQQAAQWMHSLIQEKLHELFYHHPVIQQCLPQLEQDIVERKKSPARAALELLRIFQTKS